MRRCVGGDETTDSSILRDVLTAAAAGRYPPADGAVEVMPSPPGPCDAVVAFTAHHIVAAPVAASTVRSHLDPHDLGSPLKVPFLAWLAKELGTEAGSVDVVLSIVPRPGSRRRVLRERPELADHPRAARAAAYRTNLQIFADPEERGLVVVGRGLAGRRELSVEVDEAHRNGRLGATLIRAAVENVPACEAVFAQVAPGNAASLRAFIGAGFRPIGAEVLFLRR